LQKQSIFLNSKGEAMLLFVGKNCIPCKNLKEALKASNINVDMCIADENMEKAQAAGVKSLPTLQLDDGTLIKGSEDILEYFEKEND